MLPSKEAVGLGCSLVVTQWTLVGAGTMCGFELARAVSA